MRGQHRRKPAILRAQSDSRSGNIGPPVTPCCGFPATFRSTRTTSRSRFVRASGPGGQNVNKLSTAAQLRFDTRRITLPDDAALRLNRLAGQRMTKDGVIVIHAQRFRTQERNRADAIDRLLELLREAMVRPVPRRATKPTFGSKQRRLEGKKRRSDVKSKRGSGGFDD